MEEGTEESLAVMGSEGAKGAEGSKGKVSPPVGGDEYIVKTTQPPWRAREMHPYSPTGTSPGGGSFSGTLP